MLRLRPVGSGVVGERVQPSVALTSTPVLMKSIWALSPTVRLMVAAGLCRRGAGVATTMPTVAGVASEPPALVAVTVTVTGLEAGVLGVPVIWQLVLSAVRLMVRPAGRPVAAHPGVGLALMASSVMVGVVVGKTMGVIGVVATVLTFSAMLDRSGSGRVTGAALTVMLTVAGVASAPVALRAVTVTVTAAVVAADGVPVIWQLLVLVVRVTLRPAGRLSLTVQPAGLAVSASKVPPAVLAKTTGAGKTTPTVRVWAVWLLRLGAVSVVTGGGGVVGVAAGLLLPQAVSRSSGIKDSAQAVRGARVAVGGVACNRVMVGRSEQADS